jgi:hypothetical protein
MTMKKMRPMKRTTANVATIPITVDETGGPPDEPRLVASTVCVGDILREL